MDLTWLACIGALLLLAGLLALLFDTLRRRRHNQPFVEPDLPTTLLDESEALGLTLYPQQNSARPPPRIRLPGLPRFSLRFPGPLRVVGTRQGTSSWFLVIVGCCSLLLVGLGVAVFTMRAEPEPVPEGSIVIGVCGFANSPRGSDPGDALVNDLKAHPVADTLASKLVLRRCTSTPTSQPQADAERARLSADVLVWGQAANDGGLTANLTLAPGFGVGHDAWQEWSERDVTTLLFPAHVQVDLPAGAGSSSLVPLVLALAYARAGDYTAAVSAAKEGQAAAASAPEYSQLAAFTEAASQAACGNYDTSIQRFGEAMGSSAALPEAYVNRAFAYLRLGENTQARADLDYVINDKDAPKSTLARAYLLRGLSLTLAGDLTAAMSDLDASQDLDPSFLPVHLQRAQVLYRQSQPDPAKTELDTVLTGAPDAAPAHTQMGLVWMMLGKPQEAQEALAASHDIYERWIANLRANEAQAQATGDLAHAQAATDGILQLNHELAGVYLYQGMALADQARTEPAESFLGGIWRKIRGEPTTRERALSTMQDALRLDQHRPDVLIQMGTLYANGGDAQKATETLQQALAMDPSAPEPYMALAGLQETQGNSAEAVKTLNSLLDHAPRYYQAYQKLHDIYQKAGDTGSAKGALERAIAIAPEAPNDHLWRGKFLQTLGRQSDATGELQAAATDPSLWEAHLLLGQALQESNPQEALTHYQVVLEKQPGNPTALLDSGKLLANAGRTGEAEQTLVRLTTSSPNDANGHILYSQLLAGKGELDKAVAEGQRAVQADYGRADTHFSLALVYEEQENWPEASRQFRATLERDPTHFEALIRLAASLYHEDKYAESIQVSNEATKARGDDPQAYRWRAEAQLALRDHDAALQSVMQATKLAPHFAEALALTARIYAAKGDEATARNYAKDAVANDPHNLTALLAQAEVLLTVGRDEEAFQAYGDILTSAPKSAEAMTGQGRAYSTLGDKKMALEMFASALAADKQYAEAHFYAGQTYVELNRWDDALRENNAAVQIRPHWPEALYYLGMAYLQRKDLQNAQNNFSEATKYSPNMVEAWFELGMANRDVNRREDAIAALSRATQLDGNLSEAWLYLGLTYEESGDRPKAAQAFTQAVGTATEGTIKQQAEQGLQRVK